MNICWVNPFMEINPTSAGRIQTLGLVKGLAGRGHRIHLLAHGRPLETVEDDLHIKLLRSDFLRGRLLRLVRNSRRFFPGSLSLYYYLDAGSTYPRIEAEAKRHLIQEKSDLVHIDHIFAGRHVGRVAKNSGLPLILTTHNVESLLAEQTLRAIGTGGWLAEKALKKVRETELEAVTLADHIVTVSAEDCSTIKSWGVPDHKLSVIPLGLDYPHEPRVPTGNKVIFVGSRFEPNKLAVDIILTKIAPKVPEASFEIVGSVSEGIGGLRVPSNVTLVGRVEPERLHKIYDEAAVALAPLTVGSGMRMKVLEYLAWGRPTVATELALQGLSEFKNGMDLIVENDIEEFPAWIRYLLGNEGVRMSFYKNARQKAKRYSFENIVTEYETLFERFI